MAAISSIPTRWRSSASTITRSAARQSRHAKPALSARALALRALHEWRKGDRFADEILHRLLVRRELGAADRAFATELLFGVLRNLALLDFWIAFVRPGALDANTRDLLRVGVYQLLLLDTAPHAAVHETVECAPTRTRGLVNAVLRAAHRRKGELHQGAATAPLDIRTSHPPFMIERWTQNFGREAAAVLCEWNNQPPPIYARVNRLRTSPEKFASACPTAMRLPQAGNMFEVEEMPWAALATGDCYIQDASTLLACELLAPQPGEHVLDACAAPGGKSGYIGELMENCGSLFAADRDARRLDLLQENMQRLGLGRMTVAQCDWLAGNVARQVAQAAPFDRILVDAPCSNTGVMRRRVDVRWRLRAGDFVRMQRDQEQIVRALLPLLRVGGVLVYSTCSIEPEENDAVVEHVLRDAAQLRLDDSKRLLPFRDNVDGAFAARFVRL